LEFEEEPHVLGVRVATNVLYGISFLMFKEKREKNHKNTPTAEALYLTSSVGFL
jgi:hypothetical protein